MHFKQAERSFRNPFIFLTHVESTLLRTIHDMLSQVVRADCFRKPAIAHIPPSLPLLPAIFFQQKEEAASGRVADALNPWCCRLTRAEAKFQHQCLAAVPATSLHIRAALLLRLNDRIEVRVLSQEKHEYGILLFTLAEARLRLVSCLS